MFNIKRANGVAKQIKLSCSFTISRDTKISFCTLQSTVLRLHIAATVVQDEREHSVSGTIIHNFIVIYLLVNNFTNTVIVGYFSNGFVGKANLGPGLLYYIT